MFRRIKNAIQKLQPKILHRQKSFRHTIYKVEVIELDQARSQKLAIGVAILGVWERSP